MTEYSRFLLRISFHSISHHKIHLPGSLTTNITLSSNSQHTTIKPLEWEEEAFSIVLNGFGLHLIVQFRIHSIESNTHQFPLKSLLHPSFPSALSFVSKTSLSPDFSLHFQLFHYLHSPNADANDYFPHEVFESATKWIPTSSPHLRLLLSSLSCVYDNSLQFHDSLLIVVSSLQLLHLHIDHYLQAMK